MKTGTDISIAECRTSGYVVIDHTGKFNPDKYYQITVSNPLCWTDNGKPKFGIPKNELYITNDCFSYRDLWETFERAGEGIKSYCDFKNCPLPGPDESPDFHDMAHLAQIIFSYCGLD